MFKEQQLTKLSMDFMVWCCDVITSTCLNMFSINRTRFDSRTFINERFINFCCPQKGIILLFSLQDDYRNIGDIKRY